MMRFFKAGFLRKTLFGPLAVGMACSFAVTPLQAQPSGLPNLGAASAADLSPALERTLGEAIMEQGRRDPTYVADPEINQYLTQLGHSLATSAATGAGQEITVFAVRDPQINAFALPGGYIGINSGLVVSSESESEVAGVVAHEIGHVLQRHVARGMTQQERSGHLLMASMAAALIAGLAGGGDLAMGVAAFGQAAAIDQQLGFSRQAEQEADRVGLDMMRRAGFDPQGMVKTFGRLMNASRLNEGTGGGAYASTHPLSIQRMSDMENRIRSQAASSGARNDDVFWYIRAKLRVMQARSGTPPANVVAEFKRETTLGGPRAEAAWYGLAYAALQGNDLSQAEEYLKQAGWPTTDIAPVHNLAVALRIKQKRWDGALRLSQEAVQRWPQDLGIALSRVDALQAAGQDTEALTFLQSAIKKWPREARLYQLQAGSYERLNQGIEARRAMARYYEQVGALPAAIEQLKQARALSTDFYVQSQIDVEIRRLQETVLANRALLERFR
nr:M48 family metalloprotease [Mesopusillimonas faecipullorum]